MARRNDMTASKKRPVEQYDHKGKKRPNNPPVGLVDAEIRRRRGQENLRLRSAPGPDTRLGGQGGADEFCDSDRLAARSRAD